MRTVLDTSALYYPRALALLQDQGGDIVLPVVALVERARQLRRAGRDGWSDMVLLAEASGWTVEAYDVAEARRTAALAPLDARAWARINRDAMIAGHVAKEDVLWTANPRDFAALGLRPAQILDVAKL